MAKLKDKKKRLIEKKRIGDWVRKGSIHWVVVLGGLGVGLALIFTFFLPKTRFEEVRENLLGDTKDVGSRLDLIEVYLENNQFEEAEEELKKVEELKGEVKGVEAERLESLWEEKREKDPKEISKEVEGWEEILEKYPDYRDGWLQLAVLWAKLGETEKTEEALGKALELDPNYELSQELEKLLKEE